MLDCNSAEWCILAYLYDLSCNCNILRSREKFAELKRLFSSQCEPSNSTCSLSDRKFGVDYIANPKKKVDPLTIKLLTENPQNQYNLVCNFLMEVCECNDTDKLNDIAILCCEFTAQCNSLSAEWLGALTALCNAGGSNAYHDLVSQVSIEDQSIYNRLGIFVSIMIARHCFQLQSFVISVAIPSLLKAWEDMKENQSSREAEMGARLSCHLLLKLFKTVEAFQPMFYTMGSPSPMPRPSTHASGIKYSCDRHLLSSAHRNITVGAIIAVLKAILVLDYGNSGKSSSNLDDDDFGLGINLPAGARIENASLSDFAKHTLKQVFTFFQFISKKI
jgi:mediator of RNA polymerase II transcription subunit 12